MRLVVAGKLNKEIAAELGWSNDGIKGWAAFKVVDSAQRFEGWGLGSYCFFNVNPSIHAAGPSPLRRAG
jgi:hypothetical protein